MLLIRHRIRRQLSCVLVLATIITLWKVVINSNRQSFDSGTDGRSNLDASTNRIIFISTPNKYTPKSGSKCQNCLFSHDRKVLARADAVVVHLNDAILEGTNQLWTDRESASPNQIWVAMFEETPYTLRDLSARENPTFTSVQLNGMFNWTMSYRSDSEIPIIKYHRTLIPDKRPMPTLSEFNEKQNRTVAVISNCNRGPRNRFLESLAKHYPVDVYGRCRLNGTGGSRFCNDVLKTSTNSDCEKTIQKYKFYLAIENSFGCQDYITEKYWRNAIGNKVLPIVMGASEDDFDNSAIPGSYLHAESSESIEELALRLNEIGSDFEEYSRYFKWMNSFSVGYDYGHWCALCSRLNSKEKRDLETYKKYEDFDEWFNSCPGIHV